MIHCKRIEWKWHPDSPVVPVTEQRGLRHETVCSSGHGKITLLVDRDHVAGDPPPNAAVAVARYAVLFRCPELIKVRSGWSGADGSITFTYLDMTVHYMVYASGFVGPTGARFDAVCTDSHADGSLLYPELMP